MQASVSLSLCMCVPLSVCVCVCLLYFYYTPTIAQLTRKVNEWEREREVESKSTHGGREERESFEECAPTFAV